MSWQLAVVGLLAATTTGGKMHGAMPCTMPISSMIQERRGLGCLSDSRVRKMSLTRAMPPVVSGSRALQFSIITGCWHASLPAVFPRRLTRGTGPVLV